MSKSKFLAERLNSYFPFKDLKDLPQDIYERIMVVQEKSYVPNVYLMLAQLPDDFRSFFTYNDALMNKEDVFTKEKREMIVVTYSRLNNCT